MISKTIFGLLFVLVATITISQSYAAEIIFDSSKESLGPGEIVELSGTIKGGIEGDLIALEVKSPSGEIILIRTVELGPGGTYYLKFKIPASAESGYYDITTNVELVGTEETQAGAPPTIPQLPTTPQPSPTLTIEPDYSATYVVIGAIVAAAAVVAAIVIFKKKKSGISKQKTPKFCNKCGTPVAFSKFCRKCGNVIIQTISN